MSSPSFFKDRSDLRLSARFIFQTMMTSSSSSSNSSNRSHQQQQKFHLTSFTSLRCTLIALFGEINLAKSELNKLVKEESVKLFDGHHETVQDDEIVLVSQFGKNNDILSIPVDETLFVRIAERIYHSNLELTQNKETTNNSNGIAECFVEELLKTEWKLQQSLKNNIKNKNNIMKESSCISREAFLICASSSPSVSSLMSTNNTASMLWQNLLDCENIFLNSSKNARNFKCPFHHNNSNHNNRNDENDDDEEEQVEVVGNQKKDTTKKHVSFPFLTVDQNRRTVEEKEEERCCVSKETILRCLSLGSKV